MPLNWFEALKLYNVGMSSWSVPKKDTPEFKAITNLRQGKNARIDPELNMMTKIDTPKKYGVTDEMMNSLKQFVSNLSRSELELKKEHEFYAKGYGEGDWYRVQLKNTELSKSFPVLPSRVVRGTTKDAYWRISGTGDKGRRVIIEIQEGHIIKIVINHSWISAQLLKIDILKALEDPVIQVRYF